MEKEIERQRLLELERAKTRELRYNLDMEKERQMQVLLVLQYYNTISTIFSYFSISRSGSYIYASSLINLDIRSFD